MSAKFSHWEEIISLDRYPIEQLNSEKAQTLVRNCQAALEHTGSCEIPNFVTQAALSRLIEEGQVLEKRSYHNTLEGNAYLDEPDPSLPEDHPRRLTDKTSLAAVAYDEFPLDSLYRKIYEWDPVMYFIGAIVGIKEIHRYADPMGGLNLAVMRPGDYLRWHFDQSDFVTSLAVQLPESGGEFEFVPRISGPDSPNYKQVGNILNGSTEGVIGLPHRPGSLLLFQGRHSIHRVTRVEGSRTRLVALLSYCETEGVQSSDYLRTIRYGRTEAKEVRPTLWEEVK